MAKKNSSLQQPVLFKTEIHQIQDGYYSSGPNPNLRRFVEEHAKPYNPEADNYNVPPFDKPITTTKTAAIYNMHTYWSKKPHDAIQQYIKHYTKAGDIVLDTFCGSGGTALAALMEGRAAIAIDLSPAATFITKNYCTPVELDALQSAYDDLVKKVKPELEWLYQTPCDDCGEIATIYATVYSALYQCQRCLSEIPLYYAKSEKEGYNKVTYFCPQCLQSGIREKISLRSKKKGNVVVQVDYWCKNPKCSVKRKIREFPYPRNDNDYFDLIHLRKIEMQPIKGRDPKIPMMHIEDGRWGLLQRPYHEEIRYVSDFYHPRNLRAIVYIIDMIGKNYEGKIRDILLFAINAISMNMSKLQGYSTNPRFPNNMMKGTLYTPPVGREYNVLEWLDGKMRKIISAQQTINNEISQKPKLMISTQSATDIHQIPDNTIDYIFIDPPYSYKIQFAELNFIWEAWLDIATNWQKEEIIVNDTRGKTEHNWENMMRLTMIECHRVLKPERWISVCYHDSSEGSWATLQDIMAECGFIAETSDTTLFIDTDRKSWKQLVSDKVTKRDLVINFRKPSKGELSTQLPMFDEVDFSTFAQAARIVLMKALTEHPGAPADRLYDELVSRLVRKGQFERHNFDELLRSVAEESPPGSGRWYLLETADQVDEAESRKEISAAARLETYMMHYCKEHPDDQGVHYSDLFEQYLPIQDKPRRLMQEWLPEFFFKTEEGTWRSPANEEERDQKVVLRTSGTLRRIKRFANALMEGAPPHERDIPANEATAADWIRQCRRAGLYEQGRALYEKGGFTFDELDEEEKMEVEEDYQICVRRSGLG